MNIEKFEKTLEKSQISQRSALNIEENRNYSNRSINKRTSIYLMLFCTLLTSIAQIFLKKGAMLLPLLFTNWQLAIGCVLYGTTAVIFIIALKGGELSVLYPIIATSYVWVSLLSGYYFNESITLLKWLGILSIVVGVSLIGRGSKNTTEVVQ